MRDPEQEGCSAVQFLGGSPETAPGMSSEDAKGRLDMRTDRASDGLAAAIRKPMPWGKHDQAIC